MRDLAVFILAVIALAIGFSEPPEDEDLAWIDREIARCEDGPRRASDSPEMMRLRNEQLERLRKIRARLVEGEIA
jgi:hypothetical protein